MRPVFILIAFLCLIICGNFLALAFFRSEKRRIDAIGSIGASVIGMISVIVGSLR